MSKERPQVLLGVTGCIAAFKSCEIVRGLQRAGIAVKVVMTEHACDFIGPVTFGALSRDKVAVTLTDDPTDYVHHISMAEACDAMVIAPCTANTMAKIAHGIADDLLSSTVLACTAPLLVAPACNVHMYQAQVTQENMNTLRHRGVRLIEGDAGYLACGDMGQGRMAEPDVVVNATLEVLRGVLGAEAMDAAWLNFGEHDQAAGSHSATSASQAKTAGLSQGGTTLKSPNNNGSSPKDISGFLSGKTVMVTAGPTVEPIDPVRYISNNSSGKMGYSIAEAARDAGASVILISGPVALDAPAGMEVVHVKTAQDMLEAGKANFPGADIAVFAAAVADLRPAHPASHKLKKGQDDAALASVSLTENPDILATLAATKRPDQYVVGFAAETNDVLMNAHAKLKRKHADMIVANQVGENLAFGTDDDEVWLVTDEDELLLPLMPKCDVASRILTESVHRLNRRLQNS